MSAYCRERIFFLDKSKCVSVPSLRGHVKITLNSNVGRTCSLARGCACIIAVDSVGVSVVFIPLFRTPRHSVRKLYLRILNVTTVLGAKLLSQLYSTCRAVLHAASAGDAVFRFGLSHVS